MGFCSRLKPHTLAALQGRGDAWQLVLLHRRHMSVNSLTLHSSHTRIHAQALSRAHAIELSDFRIRRRLKYFISTLLYLSQVYVITLSYPYVIALSCPHKTPKYVITHTHTHTHANLRWRSNPQQALQLKSRKQHRNSRSVPICQDKLPFRQKHSLAYHHLRWPSQFSDRRNAHRVWNQTWRAHG